MQLRLPVLPGRGRGRDIRLGWPTASHHQPVALQEHQGCRQIVTKTPVHKLCYLMQHAMLHDRGGEWKFELPMMTRVV